MKFALLNLKTERRLHMSESGRKPHVTVIMTHFGCEDFLCAAVASVLGQSHADLDLWLADDASTDDRWIRVLAPFRGDSRLRLFAANSNVGTYRLKARLIEMATSPLVAFQDSDDVSEADRLDCQISELYRRRLDIIGCSFNIIDEGGEIIGQRRMPRSCNWLERLGKKHLVHHPTCLVQRRVFDEIGSFDGTARIGADSDFILRAAQRFRIGNVSRPLYRYRQRAASLTGAQDTGYGSELRQEYMRAVQQRWRHNRKFGRSADLTPAPIDVDFVLEAV